jgi:hypothetical protein
MWTLTSKKQENGGVAEGGDQTQRKDQSQDMRGEDQAARQMASN